MHRMRVRRRGTLQLVKRLDLERMERLYLTKGATAAAEAMNCARSTIHYHAASRGWAR
jgi:hypothetical protein